MKKYEETLNSGKWDLTCVDNNHTYTLTLREVHFLFYVILYHFIFYTEQCLEFKGGGLSKSY